VSTDRETTRIVRSWLEDGVTSLPDRVLDAVLDELPATRQRRSWWPLWQLFRKNKPAVFGVAAAAVVVGAMLGTRLLPSGGLGVGAPTDDPTPTPSPIALFGAPDAELLAGRYVIDDPFPVRVTFEVPEGWTKCAWGPVDPGVCGPEMQGLTVQIIDNVVVDPCDPSRVPLDPPVGPSVDDLAEAISSLPGFEATTAIDIFVDGFRGKELVLTAPAAPNCALGTWSTADRTNGVGPGEVNKLRILDVDGVRIMIAAAHFPRETSEKELAELRGVMDSISVAP
jgi:hypothetical protein